MKRLSLILVLFLGSVLPSAAQNSETELADRLKSVMALFDQNQAELKNEIAELKESNMALTKANLKLFQDLQTLEAENARLREQLSQTAVSQLESAALQTSRVTETPTVARRVENTTTSTQAAAAAKPTSPDKDLININTASVEELITLPLIDEAMAEQIISNRPYETIEDLIINQQFGPMKLRTVSPFITLD